MINIAKTKIIAILVACPLFALSQSETIPTDTTITWRQHIEEVIVKESIPRRNNSFQFTPMESKHVTSVTGEHDVIRFIYTMPGVSQGIEGGLGMFVRGGNSGNNLIQLDGVPVYGSTHLFGLLSVFHPDIIKNVDFKTGGFSASSGDFLSSLTQISTNQLDSQLSKTTFSFSPYFVSGYMGRKKNPDSPFSFQVAGRYSLLQPALKLVSASIKNAEVNVSPLVVDVYTKTDFRINSDNSLMLSMYYSNDYLEFGSYSFTNILNWNNKIARIGWNHRVGPKTHIETIYYLNNFYSGQHQQVQIDGEVKSELRLNTSIFESNIKFILRHQSENYKIETGVEVKWQKFSPGNKKLINENKVNNIHIKTYMPLTFSFYSDLTLIGNKWTSIIGYRGNKYVLNEYNNFTADIHYDFQYKMNRYSGIELSFDKLSQFRHVVEGLPIGWTMDLIVPSTKTLLPEKTHQLYAGAYCSWDILYFSVGAYYKKLNNLVSYINAINVFNTDNASWEHDVTTGAGSSFGIETHAIIRYRKTNSTISYTLSKSDRIFEEINKGITFPAKFDRRHILNVQSHVNTIDKPVKKQQLNIGISFTSGHNATLPVARYEGVQPPFWNVAGGGLYMPSLMRESAYMREEMSGINRYKMPAYFRIDLGYSFIKMKKKSEQELMLGIYNVLNRKNPYMVFYDSGRWQQISILPIVPSVNWSIKF